MFGDETISVQGMMSDKLVKIIVKAKNVRLDELSDVDVDSQGFAFEPDTSIHQEEMVGPCVPPHLFKLKPMSQPQVPKTVLNVPTLRRENTPQTMN